MNKYEIDASGRATAGGTVVAYFNDNGEIRDGNGSQMIGRVNPDGTVYNTSNSQLGRVNSDGTVYSASNQQIGRVEPPQVHRQGALLLLL